MFDTVGHWNLFTQDEEGVTATIKQYETGATQQIRSLYLAGCEGAGSVSRKTLGIGYQDVNVFWFDEKSRHF